MEGSIRQVFVDEFVGPVNLYLEGKQAPDSSTLYSHIGKLWADAEKKVLSHASEAGAEADVMREAMDDEVRLTIDGLWELHPPIISGQKIRKMISHMRRYRDRAFSADPPRVPAEPASAGIPAPPVMAENAYQAPAPIATRKSTDVPTGIIAGGNLVDTLVSRMNGGALPNASGSGSAGGGGRRAAHFNIGDDAGDEGNDGGLSFRATEVPSELMHAAQRLRVPGPQKLRCTELLGPALATSMLQESATFEAWVEAKKLQRHNAREATTLARSLELGVQEYGVEFLTSAPAEVMIRRLMAIAMASQQNSWRMASLLEEVPGPDIVSNLPERIITSLSTRMKLQSSVDAMLKAEARKDPQI